MKLKTKKTTPVIIEEDDACPVDAIINVRDEIEAMYVDRTAVCKGLTLGLLCKQHVLLHGPGGTAKSEVADAFLSRIEGKSFKSFSMQLAKGTQLEEMFGPLSITHLRQHDRYVHNTEGRLPDCHVAILDELYRGPEHILPRAMGILNERTFWDGEKKIKVPLMTAIATTNFITEDPEMEAYKDRWLINIDVSYVPSKEELTKIFRTMGLRSPDTPPESTLSFDSLMVLQKRVREVMVSEEIFELYSEIIWKLRGDNLSLAISDRRAVWALRLAQAGAVLGKRDKVSADDLAHTMYGLVRVGNKNEQAIFDSAYSAIVSTHMQTAQERKIVEDHEALYIKYRDALKLRLSQNNKSACETIIDRLLKLEGSSQRSLLGSNTKLISRFDKCMEDVRALINKHPDLVRAVEAKQT